MKYLIEKIDYSLISKYRSELMGIAIIGIMIGHIRAIGNYSPSFFDSVIHIFSHSIFTEGFLLMSGMGVYMSLTKNACSAYYRNRTTRFFIPYLVISFPFLFVMDIVYDKNVVTFFSELSSAAFWLSGNYKGMWYVSVTVLLYLIAPPICKLINEKKKNALTITLLIILVFRFFCFLIYENFPMYYDRLSIGLGKIPMFFVGIYLMHRITNNPKISIYDFSVLFLFIITSFFLSDKYPIFHDDFQNTLILVSVFLYSLIICFLDGRGFMLINRVLSTIGKYTLELYILHMLIFFLLNNYILKDIVEARYNIIIACVLSMVICRPAKLFCKKILIKNI